MGAIAARARRPGRPHVRQPPRARTRRRSSRRSVPGVAGAGRVRRRAGPAAGDRPRAALGGPGDVVVVAGKGHERPSSSPTHDRGLRRPRGRPRGAGAARRTVRGHRDRAVGGDAGVIAIFTAGGSRCSFAGFGTPILLRWLTAPADRPADPRGRPRDPPGEGRHADDGRDRDDPGATVAGYVARSPRDDTSVLPRRRPRHRRRCGRAGLHRLRRRLAEGPAPAQPRAEQARQVRPAGRSSASASRSARYYWGHAEHDALVHPLRRAGRRARHRAVDRLGGAS